jgi:uncharacterized membrane protein YbhN (UPF0104 family)
MTASTTERGRGAAVRWLRVAAIAVALLVFGWTLRSADLRLTLQLIVALGPTVLVILLPQGVWTLLHAAAWRRLLPSRERRPPVATLARVLLSAEAARMTLPGGPAFGESLQVYWLSRAGVPAVDGMASIAWKKCLTVLTNALYVVIPLLFAAAAIDHASERLFGGSGLYGGLLLATLALLALGIVMAWTMARGSPLSALTKLAARLPFARFRSWLEAKESSVGRADAALRAPTAAGGTSRLVTSGLLLFGQWLFEAFETLLILRLLGVDLPLVQVMAIEASASLLRSGAFMVPGGLGVQDAGYVALLGGFGVPEAASVGVAFVILRRAKELLWIAVGYLLLAASPARPSRALAADPAPSVP